MDKEIWKDIKGYEGYYQVSNMGNVRSLDRIILNGKYKVPVLRHGANLAIRGDAHGYHIVGLCKNGVTKTCKVHRLVAEAFIPNPDNLSCVNHKDENPFNNNVNNLEWCTFDYNTNYGTARKRAKETRNKNIEQFIKHKSRPVVQLTIDGDYINEYTSITEAVQITGYTSIGNAVAGRYIQAGGYCWVYKWEYEKYFDRNLSQ